MASMLTKVIFVALIPNLAWAASSVMGGELDTCSKPGTALTGFTRDGHCQDMGDDDQGSHHICIQMKKDFCTVTGQPDWCEEKMQCMGQEGQCPIGNWCVCQWAFARYIQMAGGCDSIVDLVCDSTNMAAVKAYRQMESKDPAIADALQCLERRCGLTGPATQRLDDANLPPAAAQKLGRLEGSPDTKVFGAAAAFLAGSVVVAATVRYLRASPSDVAEE
eukprot:TRINITY_DN79081_c0_g1_i1.p1 TRINITY_DN79081_c0_g1~~TRINITY_DN79081_c0_g1_i1.p1  ORF type:complete len:220 (-),score=48.20 TRINITY_DN79081_c0_g1_i1:98-757(-)